jgi:hypothetical protein
MHTNTPDLPLRGELSAYAARWPDEAGEAALFAQLLDDADDPFVRERVAGHFTGSAWLVDRGGMRVLLTHHRKLGRWLQLGGHADGEATSPPLRCARRKRNPVCRG